MTIVALSAFALLAGAAVSTSSVRQVAKPAGGLSPSSVGGYNPSRSCKTPEKPKYKQRMLVYVVDQFDCVLYVKDYCAILEQDGFGPKRKECPPDEEVGRYHVYEGELPMTSSALPGSPANLSLTILRIVAAGYLPKDNSPFNKVIGGCETTQPFPVTFSRPGLHRIRYRCGTGKPVSRKSPRSTAKATTPPTGHVNFPPGINAKYGFSVSSIYCQKTSVDGLITAGVTINMAEHGKSGIERFQLKARLVPNGSTGLNYSRSWKKNQSANFGDDEKDNSRKVGVRTDKYSADADWNVEVKIIFERSAPKTDIVKHYTWTFDEGTCPTG